MDVVNTFKTYEAHLGDDMKDGNLFLSPIQSHPIYSHIWYKKTNVEEALLARMLKCMAKDACVEANVTNKSRRIGVTRMFLKNTSKDVMCQITCHRNPSLVDR